MRLSDSVHASGARLLVLTVGAESTGYHLEPMPSDFGRAFKLTKFAADEGSDPAEREYAVNVDGPRAECGCKGHAYRGHCKHADALARLVAGGRL
jgi:hypothetical protein